MVPLGAYTNIHVLKILDFSIFTAFLIFAIYRLSSLRGKVSELKGMKGNVLAIILDLTAGYILGLLGIDGSPFAIIALSYIVPEPKKDLWYNWFGSFCDITSRTILIHIFASH